MEASCARGADERVRLPMGSFWDWSIVSCVIVLTFYSSRWGSFVGSDGRGDRHTATVATAAPIDRNAVIPTKTDTIISGGPLICMFVGTIATAAQIAIVAIVRAVSVRISSLLMGFSGRTEGYQECGDGNRGCAPASLQTICEIAVRVTRLASAFGSGGSAWSGDGFDVALRCRRRRGGEAVDQEHAADLDLCSSQLEQGFDVVLAQVEIHSS
jgi:hypothetical protein